mmetsp:Transcript_44276/g.65694  ORF Transcript_44276/g.65694 Transcript_44276/m.65694 type:complete len:271 (-) Transcript_44276:914-1726(-)
MTLPQVVVSLFHQNSDFIPLFRRQHPSLLSIIQRFFQYSDSDNFSLIQSMSSLAKRITLTAFHQASSASRESVVLRSPSTRHRRGLATMPELFFGDCAGSSCWLLPRVGPLASEPTRLMAPDDWLDNFSPFSTQSSSPLHSLSSLLSLLFHELLVASASAFLLVDVPCNTPLARSTSLVDEDGRSSTSTMCFLPRFGACDPSDTTDSFLGGIADFSPCTTIFVESAGQTRTKTTSSSSSSMTWSSSTLAGARSTSDTELSVLGGDAAVLA